MRWLAVTLALLGASVALVAGIYLRNYDSSWRPPQRTTAEADAKIVFTYVAGLWCATHCSSTVLATARPNHWLARIVDRSRAKCVDINVATFDVSETHGLSGIAVVNCRSAAASAGGD
jgi:hypothetical protein